MRVYLSSLGCKLNLAEAESWARGFAAAGYQVVGRLEDAELHVINSCTVTATAAQQSRQQARRGGRQSSAVATVLAGCYPSGAPEEAARLAGVELVIPNRDKDTLVEQVVARFPPAEPLPYLSFPASHARATVKIGDGCDMRCAFCIIPATRGRQRSRPQAEVLTEVAELVAGGFREVVLTGVQISDYQDNEASLFELAGAVLARTPVERLRLTSIAPWGFDERLFELFSDPRVCRHVHLSLQSGCSATLRRMRRAYTAEAYAELKACFEAAVPGLAVTTDVIVGFPGESDEEFEESLAFVREQRFARIHAFPFSGRPGTAAAAMPGQVSTEAKRERMARLSEVAERSAHTFAAGHLGQQVEVLWETASQGLWQGLTDTYLRVWAPLSGERRNTLSVVDVVGVREGGVVGVKGLARHLPGRLRHLD